MDFNSLNKGDDIYILRKESDGPVLEIAEVVDKSAAHYDMQNQSAAMGSGMQQVVDLTVKIGDRVEPMRGLIITAQYATYNGGKQYVAADKETVMREVDRMMSVSRGELERDAYNHKVLEKGEAIFEVLNPKYKEDKAQKKDIATLKEQMGIMMGMMHELQESLKSAKKS